MNVGQSSGQSMTPQVGYSVGHPVGHPVTYSKEEAQIMFHSDDEGLLSILQIVVYVI